MRYMLHQAVAGVLADHVEGLRQAFEPEADRHDRLEFRVHVGHRGLEGQQQPGAVAQSGDQVVLGEILQLLEVGPRLAGVLGHPLGELLLEAGADQVEGGGEQGREQQGAGQLRLELGRVEPGGRDRTAQGEQHQGEPEPREADQPGGALRLEEEGEEGKGERPQHAAALDPAEDDEREGDRGAPGERQPLRGVHQPCASALQPQRRQQQQQARGGLDQREGVEAGGVVEQREGQGQRQADRQRGKQMLPALGGDHGRRATQPEQIDQQRICLSCERGDPGAGLAHCGSIRCRGRMPEDIQQPDARGMDCRAAPGRVTFNAAPARRAWRRPRSGSGRRSAPASGSPRPCAAADRALAWPPRCPRARS